MTENSASISSGIKICERIVEDFPRRSASHINRIIRPGSTLEIAISNNRIAWQLTANLMVALADFISLFPKKLFYRVSIGTLTVFLNWIGFIMLTLTLL